MLSDDAAHSRLTATIESLRYWVPTIADVARASEREGDGWWTVALEPKVRGACPVELTLRGSRKFDLVVAGETYTDRALASPELALPLMEAITEGRVVQRHWVSVATGAPRAIETIITLADGTVWRDGHTLEGTADAIPREATERHDRHFLAYRR